MDADPTKLLKLKFPRLPQLKPKVYKAKPGRPFGTPMSQKQLNALRRGAVPAGAVLNPYGKFGDTYRSRHRLGIRTSWREASMKRKRLRLKEKKAVALEAHELQQLARENATVAMQTLIEISKNERAPEPSRIAASAVILDRAYGKASQTSITASVTSGKTSDINSDELESRIKQALKRVEDLTTRTPKAGESKKRPSNLRKYH